jgi:acyl-coenzyme A synthetase/AMP-(fatty) acid ligase
MVVPKTRKIGVAAAMRRPGFRRGWSGLRTGSRCRAAGAVTLTPERPKRVIASQRITVLAAAPTAYRLMMAAGDDAMAPISGQLRVACSAGEPLNPDVGRWAERVLRTPLADHYGQTEAEMVLNMRTRLALHAYPREIEFIEELPKTPSGKVQRILLRRR